MKYGFIEAGSGPALVFLHGIGGRAETWRYQLERFADAYHVIALDLPGYGRSDALPEMSLPALAEWLNGLLTVYDLEDSILVGHSLGGMIVQEYLAAYDGGVTAVVLYATSPAFGPKDGEWQQQFIRRSLQPLDQGKTMHELAPSIARGMVGSAGSAEGVELARQGVAAASSETYRASVMCLVDFDQRANLDKIEIPCLALVGEEDRNAPAPMMEKMAGHIPTGDFVSLPHLGHLAHLENPDLFNKVLQTFLRERTG